MAEQIGMGHVYTADRGTGIAWQPEQVQLWMGGKVIAEAAHTIASAYQFWYGLHFREAFPMITHWGFRSIWTGRVKVGLTQRTPLIDGAFWGWMTFDLLDAPKRPWAILDTNPVGVEPPFPPHEEQLANLSLRLILGHMIMATFRDELPPDTWMGVTSLVENANMERAFPLTHREAVDYFGGEWRLAMGDSLMHLPLREAFCQGLGLTPPT